MGFSCALGGHNVEERGIRNGKYEFARCRECSVDLMRSGSEWKRVPRGYKVIWRPKTGSSGYVAPAGAAAVAKQVDLHGVTVVGERTYGSQRFALVVLNPKDQRSYQGLVDPLGTSGKIEQAMENRSLIGRAAALKPKPPQPPARLGDMLVTDGRDAFGWERAYVPPKAIPTR